MNLITEESIHRVKITGREPHIPITKPKFPNSSAEKVRVRNGTSAKPITPGIIVAGKYIK